MKKILLATRNNYKKEQFLYLLDNNDLDIYTIYDLNLKGSVEENGLTVQENALIKARYWVKKSKIPTLADDAGLEIDALNKEPGVKARRWGGKFSENVDDETWLSYLLERMNGISFEKRTARYNATWAFVFPNGKEYIKNIKLEFIIAEEPKRPYPKGSPMSSVRYFPEYNKIEVDLKKEEQWRELKQKMKEWNLPEKLKEYYKNEK